MIPVVAIAAILATAACSSSKPPPTTSPEPAGTPASSAISVGPTGTAIPKDETSAAKAMLLTVSDFPTGWAETPSTSGGASALDKCDTDPNPKTRTAKVETGDFSKDGTASISETLVIYSNSSDLANSFSALQAKFDCFTKTVNGGKLDDDKAKYSGSSVAPESFPSTGDHSEAFRISLHAEAKGQTGLGSAADFYIDVVYIQQGRVGVSIEASDVFSPFDSGTFETTVQKALAKVTP